MKKNSNKYRIALVMFVAAVVLNFSCKKDDELEQVRLFRPVLAGDLVSDGNWIKAGWQSIKGATSYTVQLSRDTFKTIDRTIEADTAGVYIEDLRWDQLYQIQVKANANDSVYNSRYSMLGNIKTLRFPSILNVPKSNEIAADQVKITWQKDANPVTLIKVLKTDSTLLKDVTLTNIDRDTAFKVVTGLSASTEYIIYLYSGTTIRGWVNVTTDEALSGEIVDISAITDRPSVLMDTLDFVPSGATILLKRGITYTMSKTINLTKSVTIRGKDDLSIPEMAYIRFTSNFTFPSGANVEYVRFENLKLRSDNFASRYVFNVNAACTVGEISFNGCMIGSFRGMCRFQNQAATLSSYKVNDCVVDSVKDYGVINADGANCLVENISLTNSTFYKTERIVMSTKPTRSPTSLSIKDCTFNEAPLGGNGTAAGNSIADFGSGTVTGAVVIHNNIFGPGWLAGRENGITKGVVYGTANVDGFNNFGTSDFQHASGAIPNTAAYSKASTDLFLDPANGNFTINDNTFAGKSTAGDPRWRL
ncbi:MAG: DUF5123 domain-containing protein [Chitinophagaceae bacterium]